MSRERKKTTRTTVDFLNKNFAALEELADEVGLPKAQILRDGAEFLRIYVRKSNEGNVLFYRNTEGKETEVVILGYSGIKLKK